MCIKYCEENVYRMENKNAIRVHLESIVIIALESKNGVWRPS